MANIAQTVNVLQAMILTDGPKMLLTPTYYVYFLYKVHHDATLLPTELAGPEYAFENDKVPAMNVSASRDSSGKVHVSLVTSTRITPWKSKRDCRASWPNGSADRFSPPARNYAHNTFEKPENVEPASFNGR